MKKDFYTGCEHVWKPLHIFCTAMGPLISDRPSHHHHALHRHAFKTISLPSHCEINWEVVHVEKMFHGQCCRTNWTVPPRDTEEISQVLVFTQLSCRTVTDQQPMQYALTVCSFKKPRGCRHQNKITIALKLFFVAVFFGFCVF